MEFLLDAVDKISKISNQDIKLTPISQNIPIRFLSQTNQMLKKLINMTSLLKLLEIQIMNDFISLEMFDPSILFINLTQRALWKNKRTL